MKKIIAFAGSNAKDSINLNLIRVVQPLFSQVDVEILDLRNYTANIYGSEEEEKNGIPEDMKALFQKIRSADGVLMAIPEFNNMVPAFFKNIIDWLSRIDMFFLQDKPTMVLSTSPGKLGGSIGLEYFYKVMVRWGAVSAGMYSLGNYHDHIHGNQMAEQPIQEISEIIHGFEEMVVSN